MVLEYPMIISRLRTRVSPWVELIEKTVQFGPDQPPETFHCITQKAYVGIFARTVNGLIPIVRQYRPCVEEFTWEFPAGTVEDGEEPEKAARRELLEETGAEATDLLYLGNFHPDTGRLQVDSYAFYSVITHPGKAVCEQGLSVRYVEHEELKHMMISGEFRHQLHLGIYAAVVARGITV